MDHSDWSPTCIWTSVLTAASSPISIASPSALPLTSLFAPFDKGTNTASVSEQNAIGCSEQNDVPIGTLADSFSQILQEAFGGNAPSSSPSTESTNTSQRVQQKNAQASEQIANTPASFLDANSVTAPEPDTTANDGKSLPAPVVQEALTNASTEAQSLQPPSSQVSIDNCLVPVADTAATKDTETGIGSSKPKLAPKNDKNQAEQGLANSSQPMQLTGDPSTPSVIPIEPISQAASPESSLTQNSSAKIVNTSPTVVFPDVGNNGGQVVTNTTSQLASVPWTNDNASDKDVFHLSLQSSGPQDLQTKSTTEIAPQNTTAGLTTQPKVIQTAKTGSEDSTDRTVDTNSTAAERVQALSGASGGNSGMNNNSESASPKNSSLLGQDRAATDGAKKSEPMDDSMAGTTLAWGSNSFGLGVNPVSGKEVAASTQSSFANQPTDLQQIVTGAPATEVTVRLQGDSGETISIRLSDQGGQVQVAVRSSDAGSVASLRQDLSSLTSNLERIGWKTEVSNNVNAASNTSSQDSSGSGGNSRNDSRSGSPDWEQGSRRQRSTTPEIWDEILSRQSN